MSNQLHRTELVALAKDLLVSIDILLLHAKNKSLLYNRYLLSKCSWLFTVVNLPKRRVIESLDNFALKHIHKWLGYPISGTLSNIVLPNNKF